MEELQELLSKRFSVYVGGEFERFTNFLGMLKLLCNYSDFFQYTNIEQQAMISCWLRYKEICIDDNIIVKYK